MNERLTELLLAWEDDELSAAELEELTTLLEMNAPARKATVEHFFLSCAIGEQLKETAHEESVVRELIVMKSRDQQHSKFKMNRGWLAVATIAAALLIAVFAGYQFDMHNLIFNRFAGNGVIDVGELRPEITGSFGAVQIVDSGEANDISKGVTLDLGQSVITLRNSHATLQYPDGTTIELHSNTKISIEPNRSAKHLTLQQGRLFADVAHQPQVSPLVINPGRYDRVEVMGTRFELVRDETNSTVRVEQGKVQFGEREKAIDVCERQESKASAGARPSVPQSVAPESIWRGWGRGLRGDYFNWTGFGRITFTRIDPRVDFHWGKNVPDSALNGSFAVRWSGEIEAPDNGDFSFHTVADWGVRLWVNREKLIDNWASKGAEEVSRPIRLEKGKRYSIKIEYWDRHGDATMRVLWSSEAMRKSIINQQWLYPAIDGARAKTRE